MSERKIHPETLEFLLDYLRDAPEQQALHSQSIDTRAGQLFAAGTVVIGLVAAASADLCSLLVGLAVGAYLASAVFAFLALRHRPLRVSQQADELWKRLCDKPPDVARHSIIADISDGYAENRKTLKGKHRWLLAVLTATAVEAILVGVALITSLV